MIVFSINHFECLSTSTNVISDSLIKLLDFSPIEICVYLCVCVSLPLVKKLNYDLKMVYGFMYGIKIICYLKAHDPVIVTSIFIVYNIGFLGNIV